MSSIALPPESTTSSLHARTDTHPATEARTYRNRQNAQHSTGPRTPEGKRRSSQNARKHGLTADGVLRPLSHASSPPPPLSPISSVSVSPPPPNLAQDADYEIRRHELVEEFNPTT